MNTPLTNAVLAHTEAVRKWREEPTAANEEVLVQTLDQLGRAGLELERKNIALKEQLKKRSKP